MTEIHTGSDGSSMVNLILGILLIAVVAVILFWGMNYFRGGANVAAPQPGNRISGEITIPTSLIPSVPAVVPTPAK